MLFYSLDQISFVFVVTSEDEVVALLVVRLLLSFVFTMRSRLCFLASSSLIHTDKFVPTYIYLFGIVQFLNGF